MHGKWTAQVAGQTDGLSDTLQEFLGADALFVSPLTRAIQTALLVLADHPTLKEKGLTLLRNLREIKKLGGFDTVGKAFGEEVAVRVQAEMTKVLGLVEARQVCKVPTRCDHIDILILLLANGQD